MFTRLKNEWQVVIPRSMVSKLGLHVDTVMECWLEDGVIYLRPIYTTEKKSNFRG